MGQWVDKHVTELTTVTNLRSKATLESVVIEPDSFTCFGHLVSIPSCKSQALP